VQWIQKGHALTLLYAGKKMRVGNECHRKTRRYNGEPKKQLSIRSYVLPRRHRPAFP
jgi:hypothetical protein